MKSVGARSPRFSRTAGLEPAPERVKRTTWKEFLRTHWEVLAATDFFTVEALDCRWIGPLPRVVRHPIGQPDGNDRRDRARTDTGPG